MTYPDPWATPLQALRVHALDVASDHKNDGDYWKDLCRAADLVRKHPTRPQTDRGADTSDELTEIRTILSRTRTARDRIHVLSGPDYPGGRTVDPDSERMLNALAEVIAILEPYERRGRKSRPMTASTTPSTREINS